MSEPISDNHDTYELNDWVSTLTRLGGISIEKQATTTSSQ